MPTHKYASVPSVFKVWFGKHYLVWKGKHLYQSCEFLAEGIERYIRLKKNDDTDYLYHVCNHIKRTRCMKGSVEVIDNDFVKEDSEAIDGVRILKVEQELLDSATDGFCLNNNSQAYIPQWVGATATQKFLSSTEKKAKKRS